MLWDNVVNMCATILSYGSAQFVLYLILFIGTCYFLDKKSINSHNHKEPKIKQESNNNYDDVNIDGVIIIGLVSNEINQKNLICNYLCNYYNFRRINIKDILIDLTCNSLNVNKNESYTARHILNWLWEKNKSFTSLDMRDKLFDQCRNNQFSNGSNFEILINTLKKEIRKQKKLGHNCIIISDVELYEDYEIIKCMNGTIWGIYILNNNSDTTNNSTTDFLTSTKSLMFDCDTVFDFNNITYSQIRTTIDDLLKNMN